MPILPSKWYGYVCLGMVGDLQLRMCFSKTRSPRLRTIIQVILISILYVLARMVFFQAHLLTKKNRPQPGDHLLKNLSRFFFVCIANKLKTKGYEDKKSKNNIRVALFQKTAGKKHLTFQKWHNFQKVAKMATLQRLQQNKMVTNGLYRD